MLKSGGWIRVNREMKKRFISKTSLALISSIFILALSFAALNTGLLSTDKRGYFSQPISTIILPHHDLVALQRQLVLSNAASLINPKTVILVSPNHFDSGSYNILTTDRTWRLQNAYFTSDSAKIKNLGILKDDLAFEREHGITNLLEPMRNAFPDAKIIPIIIKNNTSAAQLDELNQKLLKNCQQCLMVNSVDFSHYQPASVAQVHDLFSLKVLSSLDQDKVWQTEVDSAASLYLALGWAKLHKTELFRLQLNTNSGLLAASADIESTSYVLGWFENGQELRRNSTTFVAGYNLDKLADKRLVKGVDQRIDLNNSHEMGLICYYQPDFCGLNRLFWGPNFYRPILNGLVVNGEITANEYRLVLTPTDQSKVNLRGEAKLKIINDVREKLGLPLVRVNPDYDKINIIIKK